MTTRLTKNGTWESPNATKSPTRADLNNKVCTHREYYSSVVADCGVRVSETRMRRVRKSTDPHFNDIPLPSWDMEAAIQLGNTSWRHNLRARGDFPSAANAVCIIKEAARRQLEAEE